MTVMVQKICDKCQRKWPSALHIKCQPSGRCPRTRALLNQAFIIFMYLELNKNAEQCLDGNSRDNISGSK